MVRGAGAFLRDAVVLAPAFVLEVAGREETPGFLVAVAEEWTDGEDGPALAGAFVFGAVVPWAPPAATANAPRKAQNSILRICPYQFTK